jgi:hypothetical protein
MFGNEVGNNLSFNSFCRGASFEVVDLPREIFPLSLACGWPPGVNGSLPCQWRRLQGFRVEDPSGARKGGSNRPPKWVGLAGRGPPRPGSVAVGVLDRQPTTGSTRSR